MRKQIVTLFFAIAFVFINSISVAKNELSPPSLIALPTSVGTKLFNRSYSPKYFWPLNLQFVTQENLTYCSISSSIMVLNALKIPAPTDVSYAPFKFFTQDNFFTPEVEKILPSSLVRKQGSTLEQIGHALMTFPVSIKIMHANTMTANQFRALVKKIIDTKSGYIIANYSRKSLGQNRSEAGHMSPIAAYDPLSDRLLILDVTRFIYPPVWIKTQDLWDAMNTFDKDAHAYRGLIIIKMLGKNPTNYSANVLDII